jgi:3-oxoadipate enol-lactonase
MTDTVVLCGSLGSTAEMWEHQLPALEGRRVIAVEHPGHGGAPVTDARTVRELARRVLGEVGPGRFSFVGLSLGGAIGMRLALDAPERIERLVLACTAARFGEPETWQERAATVREEGLGSVADAAMGRWFTPAFPAVDRYRAMLVSVEPEGYARCCEALALWDVREELARITAPTLVIAGADDPSTPPATGEFVAAGIFGARLAIIPDAAHLANVERPEDFNRLLEEHL